MRITAQGDGLRLSLGNSSPLSYFSPSPTYMQHLCYLELQALVAVWKHCRVWVTGCSHLRVVQHSVFDSWAVVFYLLSVKHCVKPLDTNMKKLDSYPQTWGSPVIAGVEMAIESWGPEKSEEDSVGTLELVSIIYKEKIYSRYGKKCCKVMSKKLLKKFKWYKSRSVRMLWEIGKECCYLQPPLKGLWIRIIDESYCILNIPGTTLNVVYAFSCLTLTAAP